VTAPARRGLLRAVLTLVAGGAVAQALPLLLTPWLSRLFTPAQFGEYILFAAVAANVAVAACGRYEFALPLVADEDEAASLRALCLRLLGVATVASAIGAVGWLWWSSHAWTLWLPVAVATFGWLSLATLWATRAQAYRAMAIARVVQYGGGSLAQVGAGLLGAGVSGLIVAPIAAAGAAAALLRLPLSDRAQSEPGRLFALMRRFRSFPLLNTPHAFAGALQDTLALGLLTSWQGLAAAGFWGLTLRYLKAPATLVGGAVSQTLYPQLAAHGAATDRAAGAGAGAPLRVTREGRAAVRRVMGSLAAIAAPLVLLLWAIGPWAFERLFGPGWRDAGELARALALYIGFHFVAAPLAVVTLAWGAQGWALSLAVVGQVAFVAALAIGLRLGGLQGAGWAVSAAMMLYFGYYFVRLATWPLTEKDPA
jgi:O-antigen/teichoic acid export membrane protein